MFVACDLTDECQCPDCEAIDYSILSEDCLYDNYVGEADDLD